ncbi:hypothetical protein J7M22_07220 [Candidatus Poribacteria bacterium]|nr:hypothetical protein [Candidatus Poribacteria bacterium]
MIKSHIWLLIIIELLNPSLSFSDKLTLSEIVEGLNLARKTIRSGELRLEYRIGPRPMRPADAYKAVKRYQEILSLKPKVITYKGDSDIAFIYNMLLAGIPRREEWTVFFEVFNSFYRYRLEIRDWTIQDVPVGIAEIFNLGYQRTYLFDGQYQVRLREAERLAPIAQFFTGERYRYFHHFEQMGRLDFQMPAVPESQSVEMDETASNYPRLIGVEKDKEGKDIYILQFCDLKLWVSPEEGFCLRKVEKHLDSFRAGLVNYAKVSSYEDYRAFSGVWYPTRITMVYFSRSNGEIKKLQLSYNILEASFNVSFPESFFKVTPSALDKSRWCIKHEY